MPVLNVPFRLIFAYNPQRGGVLDNTLRPRRRSSSGSPSAPRFDTLEGFHSVERISCNERFRHCCGRRVRGERVAGVCTGPGRSGARHAPAGSGAAACPCASRATGDAPASRAGRSAAPPPPRLLRSRRPVPAGRQGRLRQPAGDRAAVGRRQGCRRQGECARAEEADRGGRQGQGAADQPAEARNQRQRDERRCPRAAPEGYRAPDASRGSASSRTRRRS